MSSNVAITKNLTCDQESSEDIIKKEWLHIARRLLAISQTGLFYTKGKFDKERYHELQDIASTVLTKLNSTISPDSILNEVKLNLGYLTPKIGVRGAVFKDNKILLVREKDDSLWSLPGGWVDIGMSASDAVISEIKQESNLDVKITKLIGIFNSDDFKEMSYVHQFFGLIFLCETASEIPTSAETFETYGYEFFGIDEIPPLSLHRTNMHHIETCFQHAKNLLLPSYY
jgi:ADP-ribose pyrophosphatase YjhB (NUDIX family)